MHHAELGFVKETQRAPPVYYITSVQFNPRDGAFPSYPSFFSQKLRIIPRNDQANFTFNFPICKLRRQIAQITPLHFLKFLGQLDTNSGLPIAQDLIGIRKQLSNSKGRLIHDLRMRRRTVFLDKALALPGLAGRKPLKGKTRRRKTRRQQGGGHCCGSGQYIDRMARRLTIANNAVTRITHARTTPIGTQSDGYPILEETQNARTGPFFIVFVITEQGAGALDLVAVENTARHARIFTGQHVDFTQHPQSTMGYVFQITNRRSDYVQRTHRDELSPG